MVIGRIFRSMLATTAQKKSIFLVLLLVLSGRSQNNLLNHFPNSLPEPLNVDKALNLLTAIKYLDSPLPLLSVSNESQPFKNLGMFSVEYQLSNRGHENVNLHYAATDCSINDLRFFVCPVDQLTRDNISEDKILDFWGEGRIVTESGLITGFTDSYNVNHQNQLVSNGKNRGSAIPNRIPTSDYDNVDTSSLIAENTFKYVTVMGSPVHPASAKEMYRIIRKDNHARVVFYGNEQEIIKNIQIASQDDFVYAEHSSQYIDSLEPKLLVPTIRPINVMVPLKQLLLDLAFHIENGENHYAHNIIQDLHVYRQNGYSQANRIEEELGSRMQFYSAGVDDLNLNATANSSRARLKRA